MFYEVTLVFMCVSRFIRLYLAGFLFLADALGLFMLFGPLSQVGVVDQAAEERGHLRPSVHLLLWVEDEQKEETMKYGGARKRLKQME